MTSGKHHIGQNFDSFLKEENIEISEEEILNMIRKMKAQQYGQSYYKCNHCGYYHLTKQNTYDSIMKQESENEK